MINTGININALTSVLQGTNVSQINEQKLRFLEVIKFLHDNNFSTSVNDINNYNNIGHTPLTKAIADKNQSVVETLIALIGVDVNQPNGLGNTPLHIAGDVKDVFLIKLLFNADANKNYVNDEGLTPLDLVRNNYSTDILPLFNNQGSSPSCNTPTSPRVQFLPFHSSSKQKEKSITEDLNDGVETKPKGSFLGITKLAAKMHNK